MVEIGKDYLDEWGRFHHIYGYCKAGDVVNKRRVWSLTTHFHIRTGKPVWGGSPLVILPPKQERAFWRKRIAQICKVNNADHVRLIRGNIDAMRRRIEELDRKKR